MDKAFYWGIFGFIAFIWLSGRGCSEGDRYHANQYNHAPSKNVSVAYSDTVAAGLDLQALTGLVKEVQSAENLEKKLNQPGGVNNLDLDENGKVDYIQVDEYGDKKNFWGFSLTTEPVKGEVQEVATIEIEKNGGTANTQVTGNQQIYGSGSYYNSSFPWGTFFLASYLFSPHPFYSSPFGYGYYPGHYSPYSYQPHDSYRNRTSGYRKGVSRSSTPTINKKASSPNQGKTAKRGITRSLKKPTSTQKGFSTRNTSKPSRFGGFGGSAKGFSSSRSGGFGK